MSTSTLAHGGAVGLLFEVGFLAVPILVFTVMAVVSSRRARREEAQEREVEG